MPTIDVQVTPDSLDTCPSRPSFGVDYPAGLLDNAQKISPNSSLLCSAPPEPIRVIDASVFDELHSRHLLSHAPDNILFPFLHGTEGTNVAQNTFFHNSAIQRNIHRPSSSSTPNVPKYRGLIWVLCDDDIAEAPKQHRDEVAALLSRNVSLSSLQEHSDDEMSCSEDEFDTEEEDEIPPSAISDTPSMNLDVDLIEASDDAKLSPHMHPVKHRAAMNIDKNENHLTNGSTPESSMDSKASSDLDPYFRLEHGQNPVSISTNVSLDSSSTGNLSLGDSDKRRAPSKMPPPAVLTGSFRPNDILHLAERVLHGEWRSNPSGGDLDELEWEFTPLTVPGGISLRNFGIQVPIYATLSDIIVYSPKGNTPNAQRLARRLESAQRKKRAERAERLGIDLFQSGVLSSKSNTEEEVVGDMDIDMEHQSPTSSPPPHEEILQYRTFILDATSEDLRRQIPNLVIQMRSGNGVGASASASACGSGQDIEETNIREAADHGNTVDFAVREREEMKDLTAASEILTLVSVEDANSENASHNSPTPPHSQQHLSRTMTMALAASPPSQISAIPFAASTRFGGTTTSTHWEPSLGQVFLGNTNDVPLPGSVDQNARTQPSSTANYPIPLDDVDPLPPNSKFNPNPDNLPCDGFGFDICIECHDVATMPLQHHLRGAEEHLKKCEADWVERCLHAREKHFASLTPDEQSIQRQQPFTLPPRPPPNADNVIHIPLPSSPQNSVSSCSQLLNVLRFIERWIRPCPPVVLPPSQNSEEDGDDSPQGQSHVRRWSTVSSMFPSFVPSPAPSSRTRSFTSPQPPPSLSTGDIASSSLHSSYIGNSRPLKVLLYSSDGYTESSVSALCLLMAIRHISLPEAYLALQAEKQRSFFVYNTDLPMLKRVQTLLSEERRILGGVQPSRSSGNARMGGLPPIDTYIQPTQVNHNTPSSQGGREPSPINPPVASQGSMRPAARSISFAQAPYVPPRDSPSSDSSMNGANHSSGSTTPSAAHPPVAFRRPRSMTSPPSMFGVNHQAWFNDSRFDGSFPSRILPFLYLGNLNHASNVYMLHALGITHVVSVGECALVPPANSHSLSYNQAISSSVPSVSFACHHPNPYDRNGTGSLWQEEREGRIKVLDIKGVCDDGIDTLEPQLEPICNWIDEARKSGGHVLVHCRVGVSRSATVTIAYVMKHLNIPLVDAYLVVRSRRLSVLIQPNMRLLYNLCGWEIRLAKERAQGDQKILKDQLSRTLTWPYLAKEVHALNEKYLR